MDVNGSTAILEGQIYYINGSNNPGTKPPRLEQQNLSWRGYIFHRSLRHPTPPPIATPRSPTAKLYAEPLGDQIPADWDSLLLEPNEANRLPLQPGARTNI